MSRKRMGVNPRIGTWNGQDITPVHEYTITAEHGESWRHIVVFSREAFSKAGYVIPKCPRRWNEASQMTFADWDALTVEERDDVDSFGHIAIGASGLYRSYRGPGCSFNGEPSACIYSRHLVVTQSGGLDI